MRRKHYRIHHSSRAVIGRYRRRRSLPWERFILCILLLALVALIVILIFKYSKGCGMPGTGDNEPAAASPQQNSAALPTPKQGAPTPARTELSENLAITPIAGTEPSAFGFSTAIMDNGQQVESYSAPDKSFFDGGEYSTIPGIITFGGSNYRNSFSYGTSSISENSLTQLWSGDLESLSAPYNVGGQDYTYVGDGVGWTGQPIIVQWPDDIRPLLGIKDEFKSKPGFTEVIYAAMDGNIYFYELESGQPSREKLELGCITKGSASLDPRGYPLLYVGQGITSTEDGFDGAWFRVIDLISNKVVYRKGGRDPFSLRAWQAYDSSPLLCAQSDTLIFPGENGVIYFIKLNTVFDKEAGTVSISPDSGVKYRYAAASGYVEDDSPGGRWYGFESSCAVWREYLFITDNGGRLQCIDMNTLELVYVLDITDDSDSSIVLEEDYTDDTLYLYTANEVDKQQTQDGYGISYHRKYNALTGELVWENGVKASVGGASSNGGTLATPHVGRGKISNLVIFAMTLTPVNISSGDGATTQVNGGLLIAYDKDTGDEVWRHEQPADYWSSPAVTYAQDGSAYIVMCDRSGVMKLHDASDGSVLTELKLADRIEATPAIFGNYIVIGTRAGTSAPGRIICVRLG